ncbi:MAG: hypothetical protein KC496_08515, partial [Anaerolineae bacterium]|nr:hypothetical protein [Anaerolineae bacterium]
MDPLRQNLKNLITEFRQANEKWRDQMVAAGYSYEDARYWAHCIDELYDEIQRTLEIVAEMYSDIEPENVPDYLN